MKFQKIICILLFYITLFNNVYAGIFISGVFPNTDDDKNLEYIELSNTGSTVQSLSGYVLKDKSGKEYIFGSGDFLESDESKKYFRTTTKILLNNTNEELFLYDDSGNLVDGFSYDESEKGELLPNHSLTGVGTGSITEEISPPTSSTGILDSSSGSIDNGTGEVVPPSPLEGEGIQGGGLFLEIPDINIEIQSGLEYLTGNIYKCKKENCKINLNVEDIFTGSYEKNNYICKWNFGSGAVFSTGTEDKCNPGYVDYGSGIFDVVLKVIDKQNLDNFGSGGIVVENRISPQPSPLEENEQEQNLPLPNPPLLVEGTGGIDDGNLSGSLDFGSGVVDSSGSIDNGTGEIVPPSPGGEGIQGGGTGGIQEGDFGEELNIIYVFQRPTYFIENQENLKLYNCDQTKQECKLNLDFRDSFTGSLKESDFNCFVDFGFGTGVLTGEEEKCNPNTVVIPMGTYDLKFKIQNKTSTGMFSTGSFKIVNNGYIKPVKKSSSFSSSGGGSSSISTKIYIKNPEIIIQSGLDENKKCRKIDCSVNLKYEINNSKERCVWDFGNGSFEKSDTVNKCNPGYVKYGAGSHKIKLRVYEKNREYNYKESFLEFENKAPQIEKISPQSPRDDTRPPSPLEEKEQDQEFDFDLLKNIEIYKVMPNPKGVDNLEYIELKNNGGKLVNLRGCFLDDKLDGGSKKYIFETDDIILPGKKKKYYKTKTKLNLNNDKDSVNLYCGEEKIDSLERNFSIASSYYLNHSRLNVVSSKAKVIYITDGDTVKVKFLNTGKTETLRLIGVDTPETKHPDKNIEKYGIEAFEFTKKNLLGKEVYIEIDKNNFRDKYGRLLGFIFVDGENFNKKLILEGYARAYLTYNFKYIADFEKSQRIAKKEKKGIWSEKEEVKEFLDDKVVKEKVVEEEVIFVDENGNGIPDEFEEFIPHPNLLPEGEGTGQVVSTSLPLEEIEGGLKINIDIKKSREKYRDFVVSGFSLSVRRLKSGLKISGKTVPDSEVFIRIKNREISYFDFIIPKVGADYFYSAKSDKDGYFEFLLTEIYSGNYILNTKILDSFGNEFDIEKEKKIELLDEYVSEMKAYVYEKQLKEMKKYSGEVKLAKLKKNEKLSGKIEVQGRLGSKKIVGNTVYCYDTCKINFNGKNSKGNIESYFWDFGNGEKFKGSNPGYIDFKNVGNYKVVLSLVGKDGSKKEEVFNVVFSKKKKKTLTKKSSDVAKNNNVLLKVTNAKEYKEKKEENKNGIFVYFIILVIVSFAAFAIFKREKII